jgi:poly(3-hydroxybutyrate) depolymerase
MQRFSNHIVRALALLLVSASSMAANLQPGSWTENEQNYGLFNVYLYLPQSQPQAEKAQPIKVKARSRQAKPALAKKRVLMLVLHGCKQTASGDILGNRAGWEPVADQYNMILAAPDVPQTNTPGSRLVAGCWDWFGTQHERGTRDVGALADMINGLKARPDLNIDPNQIYVVGLSSGAAIAQVLSCSYPELIAGVGLHSAPAMGSNIPEVFFPPKIAADAIADNCRQYAGDQKAAFASQIASILHGSQDQMVNRLHAERNRDALQKLYGANKEAGKITETNQSNGSLYQDEQGKLRLAYIEVEGLGHAFSAGSRASGGGTHGNMFHDYTHINYPAWVSKFFMDNNLRVKR